MDHLERSLLLVMMLIDTITVVMLPMLLLVPFRPWLDAARLFFLAVSHLGIALLFVLKTSSFKCTSSNVDEEAICSLILLYVTVTVWFVPALVIGYSCGLAFLVYRLSKIEASGDETTDSNDDVEKQSSTRTRTSVTLTKPNHASVQIDNYHWAI
ncbi:hypothetical protein CPC08DRAFT_703066 [Agrocybe pediades]|nr:hypothetical protein CPC08DRAFT_703066 [Agrocybe pediades]